MTNHSARRETGGARPRQVYATFFMEQHLGHRVHYQNLRAFLDHNEQLCPTWVPITYSGWKQWVEGFPLLPLSIRSSLAGRWQVRQGLKAEPCDVLYFNTQVPAALGNLPVKGRPYLIATDITPLQYDRLSVPYQHQLDTNGILRLYKQRINTRIFQGAARLLPWSSWAARSVIEDYGVDPRRVEVLPVGVDLERWRPSAPTQRERVRILFVGGNFERKGGPLLLEAFHSLPPGCAELHLVTYGNVPATPGVTVYNNIQPNSEQLLDLYRASDIFVLPSHAEAFGIAAVEASASGLPVIVTCSGGLSDIVVDQETGFLIPSGDVYSLSTHLRILVENLQLRQKMGQAARRHAEIHFDASRNAARLVTILEETVSKRENR